MVNLTRIYTRTGDDGTTSLGDFSRTSKNDPRLVAYADVDETNASIGVALALGQLPDEINQVLRRIQNELFDVGADLCTPLGDEETERTALRIKPDYVTGLEADCDRFNEGLNPLRSFILPGGTAGSALLHQARTVSRRAERSSWAAVEIAGDTLVDCSDRRGYSTCIATNIMIPLHTHYIKPVRQIDANYDPVVLQCQATTSLNL